MIPFPQPQIGLMILEATDQVTIAVPARWQDRPLQWCVHYAHKWWGRTPSTGTWSCLALFEPQWQPTKDPPIRLDLNLLHYCGYILVYLGEDLSNNDFLLDYKESARPSE